MTTTVHNTKELTDTGKLFSLAASVPPDKQALAAVVAEAFLNGMIAHELLTGNSPAQSETKGA